MNPQPVGGQAVIEGVMMKAPKRLCVAVRKPSGEILVKNEPFRPLAERMPFLGYPFLRGPVVLGETLVLGMRALSFSAQEALEEEDGEMGPWTMALTMTLALLAGLGLFVAFPHLLSLWLGSLSTFGFDVESVWFHLTDGVIKMGLFVGYIWLISQMGEIKRVFMYHGAEHKSIHCLEAGLPLEVQNAKGFSCLHPRCGTAFLLVVLLLSIMCFTLIFPFLPRLAEAGWLNQLFQILLKVFLMLPIAGLSYEVIRKAGKHLGKGIWGVLLWPGLQMQRLTTNEPTDDQLEIALEALKAATNTPEADAASTCVL
jgi:uncharacterized protein YqhQ